MSNQVLQKALQRSNVPLLANAIELGAQGILEVAGNAITDSVDGEPMTAAFLHSALAARMQSLIVNDTKTGS
ncbi:hypothetical protein [Xanthomonas phage RTH11]|nr:hypothetical protein [Xanthomonas phage RTH11]